MPLTDFQKKWIVQQAGFDPNEYTADEETQTIVPIVKTQPSVSDTPYQAKVDFDTLNPGIPQQPNTLGPVGTALGTAAEGALPSVAGGLGAAGGIGAAGLLGLSATGVGLPVALVLGAAGAYGMSKAARAVQQQVEPEEWQKAVQQGQAAHPIAAGVGALADLPLGGFGPNSIKNIGTAAGAIPKLVTGVPLAENEASQLLNVGLGASMAPIQQITESQIEGQPIPSVGSLTKSALEGAIFSKPNSIGKMMGFHEAPIGPESLTRDMLAKIEQAQPDPNVQIPIVETPLNKEQQQREQLQTAGLLSGSLKNAQERSNKMANYKSSPELTTAEEERMSGEGNPNEPKNEPTEGERLADALLERSRQNIENQIRRTKDFEKAKVEEALEGGLKINQLGEPEKSVKPVATTELGKDIYPDYTGNTEYDAQTNQRESAEDLANRRAEGFQDKYSQSSGVLTSAEQEAKANLEAEGRTGNLTGEWFRLASKIAGKRGATLALDKDLATAGQTSIPQNRNLLQTIIAKLNSKTAGADTPTHELAHIFLQDLRNSNRPRDREFVRKYDALVEQHPDYQRWKSERDSAGLDSTPEEYQATNQGIETINRALSNETGFQKWKNDFVSYLKTRWSKHATIEDYQRIMNYKLLNDPAYYKILGLAKPEGVIAGSNVANQEESNLNKTPKISDKEYQATWDRWEEHAGFIGQALFPNKSPSEQIRAGKNAIEYIQKGDSLGDKIVDILISKNKLDINKSQQFKDTVKGLANTLRESNFGSRYQEQSNLPRISDKDIEAKSAFAKMRSAAEGDKNVLKEADNAIKKEGESFGNKNQEESKLVSPTHDSVKEVINDAIEGSEDKSLSLEALNKYRDSLTNQVDWPAESRVKAALQDKEFDPDEPQHWLDLRKIYNAEHYPSETKTVLPQDFQLPEAPKPIEVPRTIPPEGQEANKPKVKEPKQAKSSEGFRDISGKKVTSIADTGFKPEAFDESSLKRKSPITPEQEKADRLSSKMAWEEIDNTKDPQATMNQLKIQHDYALEKERSFRGMGDIDNADRMANLRTAQQMRMHYLSEKKGVEVPPVERYQTQSNLKLPELHNRIEEFGKKEDAQVLPYSSVRGFTAQLDKIRQEAGEGGEKFAQAYERFVPLKEQLYGKYMTPILKAEKGLSQGDKNKVEQVLIMENRDKRSYKSLLSSKQQGLYEAIRESLNAKQNDQIKANQPVNDNGEKRLPKIDPYYYPNRISPKVAEELIGNPDSIASKGLRKDFIQHQLKNGYTQEQAQEKLDTITKAYDVGKPNLTKFNAVRQAEGIGLPDSWMRNNPDKNLSGYFHRVASDRAYHDTFETNPDVMMATQGKTINPWDKPFANKSTINDISGNENVKQVLERIHGEPFSKDEATLKSIQRVATSLFLGPLTNFHIAASSIANSLQYLRPTEAPGALVKSLTNIRDGYEKALETGGIRKNFTKLTDIWDINNTALEKWRATADMIGKVNGRDLTNNFTKAYLQNVGEFIVKSKNIAASGGDKGAIDLMKRIDPDWKSGKTYTDNEIINLGSNFGSIIHGGHDARTLPGWMLRDSAIQPFMSLASWNIAQTNAWMRHVYTPAKQGNFTPLIMSTLGSAIGGYVIKEGRELMADKKSPIPSLTEIIAGENDTEKPGLLAYNLMAMSSYVGYAGMLSVMAKGVGDLAYKNIPQGAAFPLDEVLGNSVHRIAQFVSALKNDPNMDYIQSGMKLATDLVSENIQLGRIALSWAANSPDIPALEQQHYQKLLNQKTQALRRFQMVEGIPYDEQTATEANPYLSGKMRQFKRTLDLGEAASDVPNLIEAALTKAHGDPEILKNELHKIKQNTYQTMPDPDRMPLRFMKYASFLAKTQGEDVASQYMMDYFQHKAINQAKSEMIPTL